MLQKYSWWTFRIFLNFLLGGEEGGVQGNRGGGGGRFLLKIPGEGRGFSQEGGGGGRGGPGVCL